MGSWLTVKMARTCAIGLAEAGARLASIFLRPRMGRLKQDQGWGRLSQITLPGGGTLGIYQPQHARPAPMRVGK
jgi:hypothetical protein